MRAIYEQNVDGVDYLELILTQKDLLELQKKGLAQDFKEGLQENKNLNIFIRVDYATG